MTDLLAAFDRLGIAPDSDPAAVKAAWRALVRSYHPDMARTDREAATRRLAEINAAFDAVSASSLAERRRLAEQRRRAAAADRATAHPCQGTRPGPNTSERRPAPEPTPQGAAARPAGTGLVATPRPLDPEERRALAQLAQKAAMAFQAAQQVCARERRPEPRSAWF